MPIDTSIYANAAPKPYNPLDTVGKVTDINNAMQTNKLLQQNTANAELQNQQGQVNIQQSKAKLALDFYNNALGLLAPLATKDTVTARDGISALIKGKADGVLNDEQVNHWLPMFTDDNDQNKALVRDILIRTQDAREQAAIAAGSNENIDNGGGIIGGVRAHPLRGGKFDPKNFIHAEIPPTQKAQQQNFTDPNTGQPSSAPTSSIVNNLGMAGRGSPNPQGPLVEDISQGQNQLAPQVSQNPPPLKAPVDQYSKDIQSAQSEPEVNASNVLNGIGKVDNADPGMTQETSNASIPGQLQQGFAPGAVKLAESAAEDLAAQQQALQYAPNTLTNLKEAYDSLSAAPTGTGTEGLNNIKSFLVSYLPEWVTKGSDFAKETEDYAKATKYLTRQVIDTAAQTGPNTNQNQMLAATGSPTTNINKAAALDVEKVLIGLKRSDFVRTAEFMATHPDANPKDYRKFGIDFNKTIDPRGFMVDVMPKPELKKLLQELGPKTLSDGSLNPKRAKFDNAYHLAVTHGFMEHVAGPKNAQ